MDSRDLRRTAKSKAALGREIATRSNDPDFYAALNVLPNPDPILRKLGRSDEVYDAIHSDAHVMGELRTIRAALTGLEWRVEVSGDNPADMRALELCEQVMARRPANGMTWPDTIWAMAQATFRGHTVHEVVWERQDRWLLPARVLDRPGRRFVFDTDNQLRLRTREDSVLGVELGRYKWLLTRHMPSVDNPYGVALYASCFWPYTFKHSGFRFFTKFCQKYGIPWAIGRYPQGTPKEEQDALADALARMIEDAVASIPEGSAVELLETRHSGQLVHERLIDVCNREMSKAITSQTLATEIQGAGSRAAAETHHAREGAVNESDRQMIVEAFNQLFRWITEINVPGAAAPTFEFFDEAEARRDWVEVLEKARHFVEVPRWFGHERLQIPQPTEEERSKGDLLPGYGQAPEPNGSAFSAAPACPRCGGHHDHVGADDSNPQGLLDQAIQALEAGDLDTQARALTSSVFERLSRIQDKDPDQFLGWLAERYPEEDGDQLEQRLAQLIWAAQMWGRINADT